MRACALLLAVLLVGCGDDIDPRLPPVAPQPISLSSCQLEPLPATAFGTIFVGYLAFDDPASVVQLRAEFSTDGGVTFTPATQGLGGDGSQNLFATASGTRQVFAWDLIADFPQAAQVAIPDVLLQLTTLEGAVAGTPCRSAPFTVRGFPDNIRVGSASTGLGQEAAGISVTLAANPAAGGPLHRLVLEGEDGVIDRRD